MSTHKSSKKAQRKIAPKNSAKETPEKQCDRMEISTAKQQQTPQRVSQNPSTPRVVKNAPPRAKANHFFSPFSNNVLRGMSSGDPKALEKLYQTAKRMSEQHSAQWDHRKMLKRDSLSDTDWETAVSTQFDNWGNDTLNRNQAQSDYYNRCIREAQINKEAGDITTLEASKAIVEAEERLADLSRDDVVLRSHRHTLKGGYLDTYLRDNAADMALVDLMITRYQAPHGHTAWPKYEKRTPDAQERFRKRLINRYASLIDESHYWCPISRTSVEKQRIKATHLVPYNTGEANCDYAFGKAETSHGHLMCAPNGLMLHQDFEELLDAARIIIVPASKGDIDPETAQVVDLDHDKEPYKVQVLDKTLIRTKTQGDGVITSLLDGRILEFKNKNRPKKRYLYFVAIINLMRRRRCLAPGWNEDKKALGTEVWTSPGEYLRESTMRCIMRFVGLMEDPDEILRQGPTLSGSPKETPTDVETSQRILLNISPAQRSRETKAVRHVQGSLQSRLYTTTFRENPTSNANSFASMHRIQAAEDEDDDDESGEESKEEEDVERHLDDSDEESREEDYGESDEDDGSPSLNDRLS
ncbi:uncharacterized protein EKO05_0009421 [Ascochyta rabiei]|uniref:Uncharacterized protein n=1 Tax=Didymella rabiei TaxID=5454 RepID=A0A163KXJ5_DIDRA|nr:uncharacterized protein EKO05_0009421 [Ascochyta rabiei]KZM27331.1 hypothetical protein ST47_g1532 [Ascochyta rabiei]UPX19149.1 hypothetical protein EKO05_0009421 [Ascochyta rabiei]